MNPLFVLASPLRLLALVVAAALGGGACSSGAINGAVYLTIEYDPRISVDTRSTAHIFDVVVSGESQDRIYNLPVPDTDLKGPITTRYRPGIQGGPLHFAVTARDDLGFAVATGSGVVQVDPTSEATLSILLAPATMQVDAGVTDASVPVDARPADLVMRPVDMARPPDLRKH